MAVGLFGILLAWAVAMRGVKALSILATAIGRNTANVVCLFYREGRLSLLKRARATTRLLELAVEHREAELQSQRQTQIVQLAREVEKIKDRRLREAFVQTLLARAQGLVIPESIENSDRESFAPAIKGQARKDVAIPRAINKLEPSDAVLHQASATESHKSSNAA